MPTLSSHALARLLCDRRVGVVAGVWLALLLGPERVSGDGSMLDPRSVAAVERFAATWHAARTATYRDVKQERTRAGKLLLEELRIKFQRPGRAYFYMLRPVRGREIIYDTSRNRRELLVHPGSFPDLTLSIDIWGVLATRDQHHTMAEIGFDAVVEVLRADVERARTDPQGEQLQWSGARRFDGREVDVVTLLSGARPRREEPARDKESLFAFARRVGMEPYVIFTANPSVRSMASHLDPGRVYVVPAYRGSRIEYWFETKTGMLLKQVAWNEQAELYESYEHFDMKLDPPLTSADFDPDNPTYGF